MPLFNPGFVDPSANQSSPTPGALAETTHRANISSSQAPTSGVLYLMSISLGAGQQVGHIGFCTGATPTTAASHSWQCLLDQGYVLRGHTADGATTNLAASTWYLNALVTPYTAQYTGQYFLGLMIAVSSGAVCTVLGPNFTPVIQTITGASIPVPLVGGQSSTGLTAPGTDGSTTYLAPTTVATNYYMYAAA